MSKDKVLTEQGFIRLVKELKLVSQDDLKHFVTKDDLDDFGKKLTVSIESRLINQIVESNKLIISTVETLHNEVMDRIDELELNTVKRGEFEALKRKVDRNIQTA